MLMLLIEPKEEENKNGLRKNEVRRHGEESPISLGEESPLEDASR